MGTWRATAGTNGFIVPLFRGVANSEAGFWEVFSVPVGTPGNLPDQSGTITSAVLTQSETNAFLTGSGNLYNATGISAFSVTDAASFTLGTVVLQTRTIGSELAYGSMSLVYSNETGVHAVAPMFRYELNRAVSQGYSVSSIWQWNLTGFGVSNYTIAFTAGGPSLSFDSMTLDTAATYTNAFPEQPFALQSQIASLSRWSYLASDFSSGSRPTASVFGALGDQPGFDARDAQYLLGWSTTNAVPPGRGPRSYFIRRARVTLTVAAAGSYIYSGALRDYRSYFPTDDPHYVAPATASSPVELYGVGFRGGFTNGESVHVPWASTNYPQTGPWGLLANVYQTNRIAYAASFDTNGLLVDISNNVGDNGTNEIAQPFEVAPFAVGRTTNVLEGQVVPVGSRFTFDLNLDDPFIYAYVQRGLNEGNLSFMVSSLVGATFGGPATYPSFYTSFSAIAAPHEFPLLDLEGEILRPALDGDADGLPDDWENFYFSSLIQNGAGDLDGDGANNHAEYRAATLPASSNNVFSVLSLQHEAHSAELRFAHAPGQQYSVAWSDDLQLWNPVTNPPLNYSSAWLEKSGTNLTYPAPVYAVWRDTNAAGTKRFYRIGAE
jgi:hypothetical protein